MRIVKLSDAETTFDTVDSVKRFFVEELPRRTPPGKFHVTRGRIAQDGLRPDEPILFTYRSRIVFTACAGSGLVPNGGDESYKYSHYFLVDLPTLQDADKDLREVERRYRAATRSNVRLVESQGWNKLHDSDNTEQLWAWLRRDVPVTLPEEIFDPAHLVEGAAHTISVNAYERNPEARRRCIKAHGTTCCICGFAFGDMYGEVAQDYIHVHHLRPLSEVNGEYVVDPVQDLRPVCPNCHAVLHLGSQCRSVDEVRRLVERNRG